jgi:hypothetical protein
MQELVGIFLTVFILIFIAAIYGLFLTAFRKGKRKLGLKILGLSVGTFFVCFITIGIFHESNPGGFASRSDQRLAEELGIFDPDEWADLKAAENAKNLAMQERLEREQEQLKREEEERIVAENAFYSIPSAQLSVINAIITGRKEYDGAKNDLAKGGIRRTRAKAICAAQPLPEVEDWVGTIETLTTNGDGLGVFDIEIDNDIYLGTWNNIMSDAGSNTLIDPDTELFKTLSSLEEGQRVKVSGSFIELNEKLDCFIDKRLTQRSTMMKPKFVFRFSSVQVYQP